jgi:tetratricopeptide (TPR) repeat protein
LAGVWAFFANAAEESKLPEAIRPDVPPARATLPASNASIDRAIVRWTKRSEEKPSEPAAWVNLGNALMQKSRETADVRLYDRAEAAFRKALDLDAKEVEAMVGLAWVYNSRHQFDDGMQWAETALSVNATIQEAHALLGDAAVELGNYGDALDHYQAALDIRPDLASYSRAAHVLWLTGHAVKARWLMQKAIDAGGPYAENTAWCRAALALMLMRTGALIPAEQEAEKALRLSPKNAHVLAAMGQIKAARKDYEAAVGYYRQAVELGPSHDSLVGLGDIYAFMGRHDEAEKEYQQVIALHTNGLAHHHGESAHVHAPGDGNIQLARFYADHDRNLTEALREAELAFKSYQNVFVADTLAWCCYKKGLYEKAGQTIRLALKWNTPDANILFHAGMIQAKLGDKVMARKYLYRALNLQPHFHARDAAIAASTLKELASSVERATPQTVERGN